MSRIPNFSDLAFTDVGVKTTPAKSEPWITPEEIPVKSSYGQDDVAALALTKS